MQKKKYFVFKIQKLLAPVWWRLVVWRSFLVATMSVLLSLCSRVVFLYLTNHTEISPEQLSFPYFINSGGKSWVPSVSHWCVLGTAALCRAQRLLLSFPGLVPWLFHYSGSGVSLPMAMAAKEGASQNEFLGDFFVSRESNVLWLHPLCTKIIIKNNWCTLRPKCLKWAVCLT